MIPWVTTLLEGAIQDTTFKLRSNSLNRGLRNPRNVVLGIIQSVSSVFWDQV